jgi:hypothetical protein
MTRNSNRGSQKRGRGPRQNTSLRGLLQLPPEQQREIARLGGGHHMSSVQVMNGIQEKREKQDAKVVWPGKKFMISS